MTTQYSTYADLYNGDMQLISYRHVADVENSTRFIQYESDDVPSWAVDVQKYEDDQN